MIIYIKNHDFHYETECLCRLFFPNDKLVISKEEIDEDLDEYVYTELCENKDETSFKVKVKLDGVIKEEHLELNIIECSSQRECEIELEALLFKVLSSITGIKPPWGILTGIRPVKLLKSVAEEKGFEEAKDYFLNKFLVSKEKLDLAIKTMDEEESILKLSRNDSFSLYVSIPFCPSRCSYCSFVSQDIDHAKKLIPQYVIKLLDEIKYTAGIVKKLNLRLETIYMGGGTPTILEAEQLQVIIETIKSSFDLSHLREFTVEAGRPDTISKEKLEVLKKLGVDRISINPQALDDQVLENISRKHTSKEVIDAYNMARDLGFSNINMDLIAGLTGQSCESFNRSLLKVCSLKPDSITIHTLSMKKASAITGQGKKLESSEALKVAKMLDFAQELLFKEGYVPYYLYRQSRMAGNLENVGWAKPSKQGLYNVYTMDETHTILSCGATGVSKLKNPNTGKIERIFNYKFPYEYINGFDEIINRKNRVVSFYEEL